MLLSANSLLKAQSKYTNRKLERWFSILTPPRPPPLCMCQPNQNAPTDEPGAVATHSCEERQAARLTLKLSRHLLPLFLLIALITSRARTHTCTHFAG